MEKLQIFKGEPDKEGFHPFAVYRLPHYSNKPSYSKFANFLLHNIENIVPYPSCNKDIRALEVIGDTTNIDLAKCIGCLSCLATVRNPFELLVLDMREILAHIIQDFLRLERSLSNREIFNGDLFFPPTVTSLSATIKNMNEFTSQKEIEHIAFWSIIAFSFLSSDDKNWVGQEIHLNEPMSPRDSRLDVCCVSNSQVFVGETKVSLESMLNEDRYLAQIQNYSKSCERLIQQHNSMYGDDKNGDVFLLIGGSETDLLPPDDFRSTSQIGNKGKRFYRTIIGKEIKFISANAIWLSTLYSLVTKRRLCWDKLLPSIFSDESVIGLLTCGLVCMKNGGISVQPIPSTVLEKAEQAFH